MSQTSLLNRTSYGLGHASISAKNMLFHFFFLFYFSNVLGVPEWQVLAATFIAIIIDAISDPAMGQISDTTQSVRWGRRHGWLLIGAFPTALMITLLFSPPDGMSEGALFWWMFIFMVGTRLAITLYTVPYFALGADMSTNYNERTTIVAWRAVFENVLNLSVFVIGFLVFLPDREGLEDGMLYEAGYSPFALTVGIIGIIGALILVTGTWGRRSPSAAPQVDARTGKTDRWHSAFPAIANAFRDPEYRNITIAYSVLVTLYGAISQLTLFVGVYLWQFNQVQKLVSTLIPIMVIVPAAIFAGWLSRRIDKRRSALFLTSLFGIAQSLPFIVYLLGLTPPIGSDDLLIFVAIMSGLGYAGFVGTIIVSFSMLADVSDLMALRTSKKQEALLFAGFTFANKLAFATGLIFATLGLVVIDLPDGALPSQIDQDTITGLAIYSIVINLGLMLAALFFFRNYSLTKDKHTQIQNELGLL